MRRSKRILGGLFILSLLITGSVFDAQAQPQKNRRPAFRIEWLEKHPQYAAKLYVRVGRRERFIDYLQVRGAVRPPDPIIDPTGRYIAYGSNTGCGFEGDGITIFISDTNGKHPRAILGQCSHLRPLRFLEYGGEQYLLIEASSERSEVEFWLYDLSASQFVIHAEGEIKEIRKGAFAYGQYDGDTGYKRIGTVPMKSLVNREAPLRLLPRTPIQGVTTRNRVVILETYNTAECGLSFGDPIATIDKRGTPLLILAQCTDGGFEIYYNYIRGKAPKGSIRPLK